MILILVVVLLAVAIIYNSNRNQQEVIDTVRQSVQAAKNHQDAIDQAVIKHLGEQKWREMQQK